MITLPEQISDLNKSIVDDMKPCMKKPIPVQALQIHEKFRVQAMEGDYKQGKQATT